MYIIQFTIMAKIKCTKCKDGIIGYTDKIEYKEVNVPDMITFMLPIEMRAEKQVVKLTASQKVICAFCDGTGYIDEPEKVQDRVQEGTSCPEKHDRKCIHTSDEGTSYCEKCNVEESAKNQHTDENVSEKPTCGQPKYKVGERFINIFGEHVEIVAISPLPHAGLYPYRVEWNGVYKGHFSEKEIDRWQKIESEDQSKPYTAEDLKWAKLEVLEEVSNVLARSKRLQNWTDENEEKWVMFSCVLGEITDMYQAILNQN